MGKRVWRDNGAAASFLGAPYELGPGDKCIQWAAGRARRSRARSSKAQLPALRRPRVEALRPVERQTMYYLMASSPLQLLYCSNLDGRN